MSSQNEQRLLTVFLPIISGDSSNTKLIFFILCLIQSVCLSKLSVNYLFLKWPEFVDIFLAAGIHFLANCPKDPLADCNGMPTNDNK